jgi:ATP-dependent helicase HrpB
MPIVRALRYRGVEPLPIDLIVPDVVAALKSGRDVVLVAPPGSGKTTRVPPALIDAGFRGVVVLEPRRIATKLAARRVAAERGFELGQEVGFHIRFERVAGPRTRLLFVTEGLLTRRLLDDVDLDGVDVVVFDEFHERSLHADIGLGLVREIQATLRPDLRIIVMSATLDAEGLGARLGAAVIRAEGRAFSVAIDHLERADDAPPAALAVKAVSRIVDGVSGALPCDTLVFLPGVGEIQRALGELRELAAAGGFDVLPLHGELGLEEQERAVRRGNRPRLVLATNVAETSLTLDGIALVIDTGYARVLRADPRTGVERLVLERVSRSNLTQRAGRAGRQGPGRCVRLFTRIEESQLAESLEPEILRSDLAAAVLALRAFGVRDVAGFGWTTPPSVAALAAAETTLARLAAIDRAGRLTELGKRLARLPTAPRLGRMLLAAADFGCGRDGALLAALAGNPSLLRGAGRSRVVVGRSDLLHLRDLFLEAQAANFAPSICTSLGVDARAARAVDRECRQLERLVPRGKERDVDEDLLLRCILAGFPERVARRRSPGSNDAIAASGLVFEIDAQSGVRDAELFVAVDAIEVGGRRVRASLLSEVREEWLAEVHPALVSDVIETTFDEARGRVEGRRRRFFLQLPVRDLGTCEPDPEEAARVLARAAATPRFLDQLRAGGLEEWLARIDCVRTAKPELAWPECDDERIRAALEATLAGATDLRGVGGETVGRALADALAVGGAGLVERLAPRRIELPSGRSVEIAYVRGQAPRVAGRMQEFFGTKASPRIVDGRVVVVIELNNPGGKPVQVTSDLASFWQNLYPKERRELMRRYPRHSWPEDPTIAEATAKPLPRKR